MSLADRYEFRTVDLTYTCLNYFCPSLSGPCAPAGQSPFDRPEYMAAVYCRGLTACGTALLMGNDVSGICEEDGEGARVTDDRVGKELWSFSEAEVFQQFVLII